MTMVVGGLGGDVWCTFPMHQKTCPVMERGISREKGVEMSYPRSIKVLDLSYFYFYFMLWKKMESTKTLGKIFLN